MGMGNKAIEVVLRLIDQLSGPFRKASKEVKQGSQEMAQGHHQAGDAAGKAGEKIRGAGQASEEAGKQHKEHAKHNHELEMGYMLLAAAAATAFATMVSGITKGIEVNNKQVAAFTGLRSQVIGVGKDYSQAEAFVKSFTEDGLIAQANAAAALKNLLSRGFSLDQAIEMLTRFKDSAAFGRQASLGLGEAVQSATEGIKNENSILVDNAGVTKNVSQMWKEYAAQLGKGVQSLTLAEKRQAEYNGIMNETRHQVGDAAKLAEQFAGQQAKAGKATEEASAALGRVWAGALEKVLPLWTGLMTGVKSAIDRFPGLTLIITALATAVVGMTAAFVGWLAIQKPVMAAMGQLAAQASVMWSAITGPVGLAVIAIGTAAAALYYLSTAQRRAAEAAVESAREQERAARETADATRNKVREIAREEEGLQTQIIDLEKQVAKKRAEIARQERERRREEANRFGDLIISALRKQHTAEKEAEEKALDERTDKLKEFYDNRLEQARKAHDKQLDALRKGLDAENDAIRDANDEQRELLRQQHEEAADGWEDRRDQVRDIQQAELDGAREIYDRLRDASRQHYADEQDRLRDWSSEQERAIRSVYSMRLRAMDAETAGQVSAIEEQIAAIDRQTRDEEKAERRLRREQRISELEAKALTAESASERTRLVEEAADLRAEAEREALLEVRDAQKEVLRQQIEQIRQNAEQRRDALREAQEQELENLRQQVEARRRVLDDAQQADLDRITAQERDALASLERLHKAKLEELEQERKVLDDKLKEDLDRVDSLEKAQLASAQRSFEDQKANLDAALEAAQASHKEMLAALELLEQQEKERIHNKYHGPGGLLEEATLYTEALKLVHDNNQQEILALLETYEPGWQQQGKDFVQRLADGGNEAKPAVEALAEAIDVLLLASTENVLALQDAAGDGAAELAEMVSQLDQAKAKLAEMQVIRRQIESEASAAASAAASAKESLTEAEEAAKKIAADESSWWAQALRSVADSVNMGSTYSQAELDLLTGKYKEKPQGSRHGGGTVPMSGAYQLLQGEHVLSRAEATAYRSPRLVDAAAVMGGPAGEMGEGGFVGGQTFNFDFRGSRITSRREAEDLIRQVSQTLLANVRINTNPIR